MKILIISRSAWDDTNSLGNTLSNIWSGYDIGSIANLYFREAKPNNRICKKYFSISDKDIFKNIVKRKYLPGNSFIIDSNNEEPTVTNAIGKEDRLYGFFRKNSSVLALWGQEIMWKFGRWKNQKLDDFLIEFNPDIIFFPCFATIFTHKILWYIQQKTNAKVALFHADDYLTVRGLGGSIFTLMNRYLRARVIKKSASLAALNYCISPKQQTEYMRILHKEMKLLYKGANFLLNLKKRSENNSDVIRIVYIGSILYGRWQTLGMLARAINNINIDKPSFDLSIYSQYEPSEEQIQTMVIEGSSRFIGKVPATKVSEIMRDSDIVLHVESFDRIERAKTYLSFSTKIVDCLNSGRCVMAIGWQEAASIDYLVKNEAALVAFDEKSIEEQLNRIVNEPEIVDDYAQKAWECGNRNHQIDKIQEGLYNDLSALVNRK